jgi:hypothetical protein
MTASLRRASDPNGLLVDHISAKEAGIRLQVGETAETEQRESKLPNDCSITTRNLREKFTSSQSAGPSVVGTTRLFALLVCTQQAVARLKPSRDADVEVERSAYFVS